MTSQATSSRWLLATGGPQFRRGVWSFLLGCPKLLARGRELDWNTLDLGGDAVERCAQPEVGAELLERAGCSQLGDRLVGIVLGRLRLLPDQLLHLLVGDLQLELVGDRLE